MRVISGSAKKRQLKVPKGIQVRPTSDRVKEALFNIIGPLVPGCVFLDLFAGTGSIGIEALSRGAQRAVFVESKSNNIKVIKENLSLTGFEQDAQVMRMDVPTSLPVLKNMGLAFDLIFMDPPYSRGFEGRTLAGIAAYGLIKLSGMVIVESRKKDLLPPEANNLKMVRQEKYGDTMLSFYIK